MEDPPPPAPELHPPPAGVEELPPVELPSLEHRTKGRPRPRRRTGPSRGAVGGAGGGRGGAALLAGSPVLCSSSSRDSPGGAPLRRSRTASCPGWTKVWTSSSASSASGESFHLEISTSLRSRWEEVAEARLCFSSDAPPPEAPPPASSRQRRGSESQGGAASSASSSPERPAQRGARELLHHRPPPPPPLLPLPPPRLALARWWRKLRGPPHLRQSRSSALTTPTPRQKRRGLHVKLLRRRRCSRR